VTEAATGLDAALRAPQARRLHLAPLDLAQDLPPLEFGSAKVCRFTADELRELVDERRLKRAHQRQDFDAVNASLKFPENQRFEIVGFLALLGRILWFDPRREHSSIPTANSRSRRAQGLSRLAASSRPPAGLGLDWPEHGGILNRIGAGGAHHIIGKFKPLVLGEIHAAGDTIETAERRFILFPPS
jgi:hypothetical protein